MQGIAWTGAAKWTSQILVWGSTVVVARVLSPEDYGIVGMATVFTGLVAMLSEFGLGSAVVTLRSLGDRLIAQLNTVSVLLGVAAFAVACAAAVPLSRFYGVPEIRAVVVALGVGFIVSGFRSIPEAALQKELRFRVLALVEGGQALIMAAATVALALLGFRYWSLVLGTLLGGFLSSAAAVLLRPHRFARPEGTEIAPAFAFSWHVLGSRLAWYAYSSADFLIVGRILGQSALGYYTLAWSIASLPVGKVTALILRVTPAVFSSVQEDVAALRRLYLGLLEGLSLVTFPATLGIALVAEEFVLLAFGEKWRMAVPTLQLLACYASLRSITPLLPQVLTVLGDARFVMRNNLLAAAVLPVGFVLGARWGILGVAATWVVLHPLVILRLFLRTSRRLEVRASDYAGPLWPAFSGSAVLVLTLLAGDWILPERTPLWIVFAAKVAAGIAAYGAVLFLLHRSRLRAFRALVDKARGRGAAPSPGEARPSPTRTARHER